MAKSKSSGGGSDSSHFGKTLSDRHVSSKGNHNNLGVAALTAYGEAGVTGKAVDRLARKLGR
jgi:hypothetical protein